LIGRYAQTAGFAKSSRLAKAVIGKAAAKAYWDWDWDWENDDDKPVADQK
jgi:hypothetical protein